MYTTFEPYCEYIKGKGYAKGFLPCVAKCAMEKYENKKSLAYLVNYFLPSGGNQNCQNQIFVDFDVDMCTLRYY
ncbi:MAG: hypothetical protein ACLTUL_03125 [Blautia faecis]